MMKKNKKIFVFLFFTIHIIIAVLMVYLFYNFKNWESSFGLILATLSLLLDIKNYQKSYFNIKTIKKEDPPQHFVDRDEPLRNLIDSINHDNRLIFISGSVGIGKTLFLLKFYQECSLNKYKFFYIDPYPVYLETSDNISLRNSLINKLGLSNEANNKDIISYLDTLNKKTKVLIIDDSSTSFLLNTFEFIDTLQTLNRSIFFVVASCNFPKTYNTIKLTKFSKKEIFLMAEEYKLQISDDIANSILKFSDGLPILISLILKNYMITTKINELNSKNQYIRYICNCLSPQTLDLLKNISFYNIQNEKINFQLFRRIFNYYTIDNIQTLENNGIIKFENKKIIINEYMAKEIRKVYDDERYFYFNLFIKNKNFIQYDIKKYIMFILCFNKIIIDETELIMQLYKLFQEKNFIYIVNLYKLLIEEENLNLYYDTKVFKDHLTYFYFHSLLELGKYKKAYSFVENEWPSSFVIHSMIDNLAFNFNFDMADLFHYRGDFQEAITQFQLIENSSNEYNKLKCLWGISHCYRHMGSYEDLQLSLDISNNIDKLISSNDEYFALYLRNKMSIILINLFLKNIDYDYQSVFNKLIMKANSIGEIKYIKEIQNSRQRANYYKIIKNDLKKSYEILSNAIRDLEDKGYRIKYDYYFEIAEVIRKQLITVSDINKVEECNNYYQKALQFAQYSSDISLHTITNIGIIIFNIQLKKISINDLNKILDIREFCQNKKIYYMLNWCILIQEYLDKYFHNEFNDLIYLYKKIINLNLFVM